MKVLHCITGLTGDGAQRMLLRLVAALRDHGVASHIVNLGEETHVADFFRDLNIPVDSLCLSPSIQQATKGFLTLREVIRSVRPDVLQGWMYHANILLLAASRGARKQVPLLWNIRRGLDDFSQRSLKTRSVVRAGAWFSRGADHIVYCSHESRAQHEAMGYHPHRGRVLENGFQTERFVPSKHKRDAFRARHGLGEEDFVIGNVGRFDVAKGHVYLLEAFAEVAKIVPTAHLVLLGRGVDKNNRFINAKIGQIGLGARVHLLGEQESIEDIYPGFDIYCSPSLNEGFPNALSESMSCALPCVVTDTGASRQLVDGIGIVVRSKRSEELAGAIITMAQKPAEERTNLGALSRQRIVERFGLDRIVNDYYQVYKGVHGAVS